MTLRSRLQQIGEQIDVIDAFLIDSLSRGATWLAPTVPAAMVYNSAQVHIEGVGHYQALIMAIVIELLGLSVVSNWLNVNEYNRLFKEHIKTRWHAAMVAFYITTILAIIVGLKVAPITFGWLSIIMLSMLSFLSAATFVQRRQHSTRLHDKLSDIEEALSDKRLTKRLRQEAKIAAHQRKLNDNVQKRGTSTVTPMSQPVSQRTGPEERKRILLTKVDGAQKIDYNALSQALGVSSRTVRRDIDALVEQGELSLNGANHE